jgi:hypothetical protein
MEGEDRAQREYRARRMEQLNRDKRTEDVQRVYRQSEQNVATMQGRTKAKAKACPPPPSLPAGEDGIGNAAKRSSTTQHQSKAAAVVWRWAGNPRGVEGIPQLPPNPPERQDRRSDCRSDLPAGPPAARPAEGPLRFDPNRAPPANPIFPPGYKRTSAQKKYEGLFHHLPEGNLQADKSYTASTTHNPRESAYEHPNWEQRANQPMAPQPYTSRDKTLPLRMSNASLTQSWGAHLPRIREKSEEQLRASQNDTYLSSSSQWRPNPLQTGPPGVPGKEITLEPPDNAMHPIDPWTILTDEENMGILDDELPRTKESAGHPLALAWENSAKAERERSIEAEVQARVEYILDANRPHQQPDLIYNGMRIHRCLNCRNRYQCTQPEGPLHLQNEQGLYDCKYCGGTVASETALRVHHNTCSEVIRLMKEQKPQWDKTPHTVYQALPDTVSPETCHCTQCNLHWCHNTPGMDILRQQRQEDEEEIMAWKMRILSHGYVKRGYTEKDRQVRQKILNDLIRAECDCSTCMVATTAKEGCLHSQQRRNRQELMANRGKTAEGQRESERNISSTSPPSTGTVIIVDANEGHRSHRAQSHPRHGDPDDRDTDFDMEHTPPNCVDPHTTYRVLGKQDPPKAGAFTGPLHHHDGRLPLSDDEEYCPEEESLNWEGTDDNTGRRAQAERTKREKRTDPHDPFQSHASFQEERNWKLREGTGVKTSPNDSGLSRYSDRQYPWARANRSISPRNTGTKRKREWVPGTVSIFESGVTWNRETRTWEVDEDQEHKGHSGPIYDHEDQDRGTSGHLNDSITEFPQLPSNATKENAMTEVCGSIHLINWNDLWDDNHYGRPSSNAIEEFKALVKKTGIPLEEWAQVVNEQKNHDLQKKTDMEERSETFEEE